MPKISAARLGGLALSAALTTAAPAAAAVVVDQGSLIGDGLAFRSLASHTFTPGPAAGPWGHAQSFTVGVGGRLEALSLGLINRRDTAAPVTLKIWEGVPRRVSDTALYEATWTAQPFRIPTAPAGAYLAWSALPTFDLSGADLMVTPGQVLTFAVISAVQMSDVGPLATANSVSFTYARGAKYAVGNAGAITPTFPASDLAFRTFVETAPAVPEPGTWALMILGFGLAGAGLRLRRLAAA